MKKLLLILAPCVVSSMVVFGGVTYTDNGDGTVTKVEQVVIDKVGAIEEKRARLLTIEADQANVNINISIITDRLTQLQDMLNNLETEKQRILGEIAELEK